MSAFKALEDLNVLAATHAHNAGESGRSAAYAAYLRQHAALFRERIDAARKEAGRGFSRHFIDGVEAELIRSEAV